MDRLIRVLAELAEAQSSFDVKGEAQQDGSYKITSPAEITTFSDNIVVSYPAVCPGISCPVYRGSNSSFFLGMFWEGEKRHAPEPTNQLIAFTRSLNETPAGHVS
jgi:hypothetical protein